MVLRSERGGTVRRKRFHLATATQVGVGGELRFVPDFLETIVGDVVHVAVALIARVTQRRDEDGWLVARRRWKRGDEIKHQEPAGLRVLRVVLRDVEAGAVARRYFVAGAGWVNN